MNRLGRILCVFLLSVSSLAVAQSLGTGLYNFGSFDSRGFDSINIGNLNTHFEIPIVSKQGRGLPFNYAFVYEGLIWSSVSSAGTSVWQSDPNWGFHGQLFGGFTGYISHSRSAIRCSGPIQLGGPPPVYGSLFANYVYHDPYGRKHAFDYTDKECEDADPVITGDGSTSDGSGFSYGSDGLVHTKAGLVINAPTFLGTQANGSITDSNGNVVMNNGNGTFTDTLGVTALTIGGSGSAASPLTLTYPVTLQADSATTATATVSYRTYTVQTNFQCSGISESGATSVDLVDHITLPDASASTYSFTYEATPGISGTVTGRLASVTLPTGGTITYSYSGGCNGSGINSDGTANTLTRATTDGSRNYTMSTVNANATSTTVQDEKGNQSRYEFSYTGGLFYETHRQIFQGAIGGAALLDKYTCYNGVPPGCDGAVVTPPFSQTTIVTNYNNGAQDSVVNTYDASGMQIGSVKSWWGSSAQLTQSFSYTPQEQISMSETWDGSNNLIAQTSYGYDETAPTTTSGIPQHSVITGTPGNQTSSHVTLLGSNSSIDTTTVYYDTGVPVSTTTPNGATQFSYDSAQTFATTTTLPTPSSGVSLAISASYDQQSGALTSASGVNAGQTTQVAQYDRLLRPTSASLPNGSVITVTYSSNDTEVNQTMGSGANADNHTLVDAYGRKSRVAVYNGGQPAKGWYQVDYCYDATGLLQFQSTPYQGSGFSGANATKQCSGNGTSYTYDALGRVTSSTNTDGTTYTQYWGRSVLSTDVNGVQTMTKYDLLGRISSVCEISSNSSMPASGTPVSCGMDIAGTGFLTNYSYDLANHKTTVTQGAQTRVFQTDAAGRTIYTKEPERGETNYSYAYNATGLQVTRTRPQANQTNPSVLTTTTTQYDSLSRVLSISYSNDTVTSNKYFAYDSGCCWPNASSATNLKGKLVVIGADTLSGSNLTGALFSYDIMGNVTNLWQCGPSTCPSSTAMVSRPLSFAYDLAGNLTSESDGASGSIAYSRSPAGEVTSITNQTYTGTYNPANLVSNVVNGPNGPISYSLGNGLCVQNGYDSMGRNTQGYVLSGATQPGCTGGTEVYAFLMFYKGRQVPSTCDTVTNPCSTYGYDEFNRLTSRTQGQNFTYSYDRYGNRWAQNAPQGGPAPSFTFNTSNNQISGFSYDAAGNQTSDGVHSYTYDAEGNLLQVDDGTTARYAYDALNRRASVQTASSAYEYVFDYAGRRISSWLTSTNSGTEGRIYWDGKQIAYRSQDGTTYFDHQDWMGTERVRTDYAGIDRSNYGSLPFGDALTPSVATAGADQDNAHYALLDHDSESSTEHAQFRQYSSTQGRWMSPDPYDGSMDIRYPQTLNRYAYVGNNPLGYTDPTGLIPICLTTSWTEVSTDDGQGNVTVTDSPGSQECWDSGGGGGQVGGGGGGGASQSSSPFQWTPPAPSKATCAGKTVPVGNNIRVQSNSQGVITGVGVVLTGASGYQSGGSGGYTSIAPNTILGVSLGAGGALNIGLNNPLYFKPGGAGAFTGAYITSATFNNGSFSQVSGAVAFEGVPFGSRYTPSGYLANQFNQNSSLTNVAQLLQSTAQLAQSLVGCSVVVGH
jgi:RHS repeat-associated protein